MAELPRPPIRLAQRVGSLDSADPWSDYERIGTASASAVRGLLPEDWSFEGRRILDFGCGAGRVLRHFHHETRAAEFWGCDIDRESIDWANENLSPPFRFLHNDELPPLPFEAEYFDLVYAMSVFTHLLDSWSAWLLEIDRTLRPGGMLIASFLGPGMTGPLLGETYDEARIGANQVMVGKPWELGGPCVIHSGWWLRAHWGRLFEIVSLYPGNAESRHGHICVRKDDRTPPTPDELEQPEPGEAREFAALKHNLHQLKREIAAYEASPAKRLTRRFGIGARRLYGRAPAKIRALRDR